MLYAKSYCYQRKASPLTLLCFPFPFPCRPFPMDPQYFNHISSVAASNDQWKTPAIPLELLSSFDATDFVSFDLVATMDQKQPGNRSRKNKPLSQNCYWFPSTFASNSSECRQQLIQFFSKPCSRAGFSLVSGKMTQKAHILQHKEIPRYDRTRRVTIVRDGEGHVAICSCGHFQRKKLSCHHIRCIVGADLSERDSGIRNTKLHEAHFNHCEAFTAAATKNVHHCRRRIMQEQSCIVCRSP